MMDRLSHILAVGIAVGVGVGGLLCGLAALCDAMRRLILECAELRGRQSSCDWHPRGINPKQPTHWGRDD